MEWLLRIPKSEWSNPERAIISSEFGRYKRYPKPRFSALAAFLESIEGQSDLVVLGYAKTLGSEDLEAVLYHLHDGRFPELVDIYERGIPKRRAQRHGLLISEKTNAQQRNNPLFPDFFDEYVPFTCVEGVMTPVPETPGLTYWFRDRCSHPDFFRGIDFFGKSISGKILPPNGKLVFDLETGDLWWLDSN